MEALPLPFEARKQHKSFWGGFPKPKSQSQAQNKNGNHEGPPPSSLLLAPTDPPRTPSPLLPESLQTINTEVSPLPSPLMGPRLELDPLATPGAKTNSFFGSSWKSLIPTPAPPLPPPIQVNDQNNFLDIPGGAHANNKLSKPVDIPTAHVNNVPLQPSRSQTTDFFSTSHKYIPSPPPSIHHLSPDERPDPAQRLGLTRLFSGHVTEGIRSPDEFYPPYPPSHSRSSSRSSASGFGRPRDFIYWTPESSDLSRSSSISSVSGVRRDFALTPRDDFSSSPSNYPASPLARIRDEEEDPESQDTPVSATSPNDTWTPTPTPIASERPMSHHLVRRETRRNDAKSELEAGMVIGDEAPLCLVRLLGKGAFSSVWLARDIEDRLIPPGPKQRRRKSVSTARRKDDPLPGLRPAPYAISHVPGGVLNELDGEGACLPRTPPNENEKAPLDKLGKLVAVKMLDRVLCDVNDRTRIAFVREVEVLRVCNLYSSITVLNLTFRNFLSAYITPFDSCVLALVYDG